MDDREKKKKENELKEKAVVDFLKGLLSGDEGEARTALSQIMIGDISDNALTFNPKADLFPAYLWANEETKYLTCTFQRFGAVGVTSGKAFQNGFFVPKQEVKFPIAGPYDLQPFCVTLPDLTGTQHAQQGCVMITPRLEGSCFCWEPANMPALPSIPTPNNTSSTSTTKGGYSLNVCHLIVDKAASKIKNEKWPHSKASNALYTSANYGGIPMLAWGPVSPSTQMGAYRSKHVNGDSRKQDFSAVIGVWSPNRPGWTLYAQVLRRRKKILSTTGYDDIDTLHCVEVWRLYQPGVPVQKGVPEKLWWEQE